MATEFTLVVGCGGNTAHNTPASVYTRIVNNMKIDGDHTAAVRTALVVEDGSTD
jgi:hypothetical protein